MPSCRVPASTRKAADRFVATRARSRACSISCPDAYYERPIALRIRSCLRSTWRHSTHTLIKRALGQRGIDADLERLFARGIDPEDDRPSAPYPWPVRREVQAFAAEADRRVLDALLTAPIEQSGHPLLDRAEAVHAILEHEAMHQETLLYMWHQLAYHRKVPPADRSIVSGGTPPRQETIAVPPGAQRSASGVGGPVRMDNGSTLWDSRCRHSENRYRRHQFRFLGLFEADGYRDPRWWAPDAFECPAPRASRIRVSGIVDTGRWQWRGMFEAIPLPAAWPVYVSHSEASAYRAGGG